MLFSEIAVFACAVLVEKLQCVCTSGCMHARTHTHSVYTRGVWVHACIVPAAACDSVCVSMYRVYFHISTHKHLLHFVLVSLLMMWCTQTPRVYTLCVCIIVRLRHSKHANTANSTTLLVLVVVTPPTTTMPPLNVAVTRKPYTFTILNPLANQVWTECSHIWATCLTTPPVHSTWQQRVHHDVTNTTNNDS